MRAGGQGWLGLGDRWYGVGMVTVCALFFFLPQSKIAFKELKVLVIEMIHWKQKDSLCKIQTIQKGKRKQSSEKAHLFIIK